MKLHRGQNALRGIILHKDHDSSEIGKPEIYRNQTENMIKRQEDKLLDFSVIKRGNSFVFL